MVFIPAAEYAHLIGIADPADVPAWLPALKPGFLALAGELDATRVDGRYTDASVAFAMGLEHWDGRPDVVLWVLLRALLGQPGGGPLFKPEVVDCLRWSTPDALWIVGMTPARKATAHLILAALDCVHGDELPLAAGDIARLREVVTDPGVIERLDKLDARIAAAPRIEDVLDPRFIQRISGTLSGPIREMLFRCEVKRPARPTWWWRERMKSLAHKRQMPVREILTAIPAHLEEHGGFTQGEDTLRGLIFVAEAFGKGWINPVLADVILAAGGTIPPRSQKLANAAVEALYYRPKARNLLNDLGKRIPNKTLKARIVKTVEYMDM